MAYRGKNYKGIGFLEETGKLVFQFFNEVGIIQQLSSAMLNKRLPDGLHVSHFSVLNHMARLGDGSTPVQLASAFQVTKATMTHTLATLEKRGLIEMVPNEKDGRSKIILMTHAGRVFHGEAIQSLAPLIEFFSDKLDLEKVVELVPELEKIRIVLDENRDAS